MGFSTFGCRRICNAEYEVFNAEIKNSILAIGNEAIKEVESLTL